MYRVGDIEVALRPANRDFSKRWKDFGPSKEVLPKGWRKEPGRRPLDGDLIFERDVPVVLRDGCKIYMDVFRPPSSDRTPVAAIVAWSPYGKQGNGKSFDHLWSLGVALNSPQASRVLIVFPGGLEFQRTGRATWKSSRLQIPQNGAREAMRSSTLTFAAPLIRREIRSPKERR